MIRLTSLSKGSVSPSASNLTARRDPGNRIFLGLRGISQGAKKPFLGPLALGVLSVAFVPSIAEALLSGGTLKKSWNHHNLRTECGAVDLLKNPGLRAPNADWQVTPGSAGLAGIPAETVLTMGPFECETFDDNNGGVSLGTAMYYYKERWLTPVASKPADKDRGQGNEECGAYDPDTSGATTGSKGKNKGGACQTNQTCTYDETSDLSRLAIKGFCQEEVPFDGRGNGYLVFVGPGDPPPWTNCYPETQGNPNVPAEAGDSVCQVLVGGFPTIDSVVDPFLCNDLFSEVGGTNPFELKQALNVVLEYRGACTTGIQPPADQPDGYPKLINAYSRVCSSDIGGGTSPLIPGDPWLSGAGPLDPALWYGEGNQGDGFDNAYRECFTHPSGDSTEKLGLAAQSARYDTVTSDPPNGPVNLKCNGDSDEGVVKFWICGSDTLDVETDIARDTNGLPLVYLESGLQVHDYSIEPAISGPCAPVVDGVLDTTPDIRLTTYSCATGGTGVAQIIWEKAQAGEECDGLADHGTCPVTIRAQGANASAPGVDILYQSVMDVEVVNVKEIPVASP